MFNNILLAVDLSKAPEKAFQYAIDLSSQLGGKLQLVYVFHPKQLKGWLRTSKRPEELKAYFQNRLQLLNPLKKQQEENPSFLEIEQIPKRVIQGFPEKALLQLIRKEEIDLILLNTDAFSYPFNEDFDTVVSSISIDSPCPVLLLTSKTSFQGFEKILFATDWKYLPENQIEYISGLAYLFNAEIHILHFTEQENFDYLKKEIKDHLEALTPGVRLSITQAPAQLMVESINDYLSQEAIQLINILSYNRYFWSDFLKQKIKNRYPFHKDLPILINYFDE